MNQTEVAYRTCFSTESGKAVMANMLILAGYFDSEMKTAEELAVLNFMKKILKNCGLHPQNKGDGATVKSYVQKLFDIPLRS